jgi:hypothetical protein
LYDPDVQPGAVAGVIVSPSELIVTEPWKTLEFTSVGTTMEVPDGTASVENPTTPEDAVGGACPKAAGAERRAVPRRVSARRVFMEEKIGFR